jgi:translation initiation factor 1
MPTKRPAGGMVYSTEMGRMCPTCRRPQNECSCRDNSTRILGDGRVRVGRSTNGRAGKCVTLISGLPLTLEQLADLSAKLKKRCGSGGTVKDGTIEIQGDHREVVMEQLLALGYKAKPTGG